MAFIRHRPRVRNSAGCCRLRVLFDVFYIVIDDVINGIDDNSSGVGNFHDSAVALDASRLIASALLGVGFRFGHG